MALDVPAGVRVWRFCSAPPEFQELFPVGRDEDWVAHVAEPELRVVAHSLLVWRPIHPVHSVVLVDGSVVYCGSPSGAMAFVSGLGAPVTGTLLSGEERRSVQRVRLECRVRYETHSKPVRAGEGRTIDMSSSGISFTTESGLEVSARITLFVAWPVPLEDDVPIELWAIGTLVWTKPTTAALRLENISFVTTGGWRQTRPFDVDSVQ